MAVPESPATGPKPFVLVLMPFKEEFSDTYEFGIKGAAQDVGAYAERIDEQIFQEGILDRIFNQINKADVIVADMTGQNPNVFYEVGYAHALNKVVVLLTQDAADIPFDLKHRQHIPYGGKIKTLRPELARQLAWAIKESRRRGQGTSSSRLVVFCGDVELPELSLGSATPSLTIGSPNEDKVILKLEIRNEGDSMSENFLHIYLFAEDDPTLIPGKVEIETRRRAEVFIPFTSFGASEVDKSKLRLSRRYRIPTGHLPQIPPGAVELITVAFRRNAKGDPLTARFSLRIHRPAGNLDFPFHLKVPRRRVIEYD